MVASCDLDPPESRQNRLTIDNGRRRIGGDETPSTVRTSCWTLRRTRCDGQDRCWDYPEYRETSRESKPPNEGSHHSHLFDISRIQNDQTTRRRSLECDSEKDGIDELPPPIRFSTFPALSSILPLPIARRHPPMILRMMYNPPIARSVR